MKKINFKKVIIAIILAVVTIAELFALGISKAKKVSSINLYVTDLDNILSEYILISDAFDGGENGYYIELPQYINSKEIDCYFIREKEIIKNTEKENSEVLNTVEITEEETEKIEETEGAQENEITKGIPITEETIQKKPGDKIYLTEQEIENNKVDITAKYKTKTESEEILYSQKLEAFHDTQEEEYLRGFSVAGYFPDGIMLVFGNLSNEEDKSLNEISVEGYVVKQKINLQLMQENRQYETNSNENYTITISKLNPEKTYKIVKLEKNSNAELENSEIDEKDITYEDDALQFSMQKIVPFAILEQAEKDEEKETEENQQLIKGPITKAPINLRSGTIAADVWDGTVASSFKYGEGTASFPYLITTAKELAYLASRVNAGTTYQGIYFQLTRDLDLNNREWTPIGDISNSFRGVFDGAGHAISNATITISTLPTTLTSYGMFGSIGGSENSAYEATIKNVEFDNINISITASGTTANSSTIKGYHLGIVTGTMYGYSQIINVIAKNSSISNTQRITLYNYYSRIAVGGICGVAQRGYLDEQGTTARERYKIENCYSDVDLDVLIRARNENRAYFAQHTTGGIIGTIIQQPVWPSNCLYRGSITSRAFTGPVFGQLRGDTSYTSTSNYDTLWQGNDLGNLTATSYYTGYTAGESGTSFTSTVTTGTSNSRVSTNQNSNGYVQGVNKGIYTNNMNTMLHNFENYVTAYSSDNYNSWTYSTEFRLNPTFEIEIDDSNKPAYTADILNRDINQTYTYSWYIDGVLNTSYQGDTIVQEEDEAGAHDIVVIVHNTNNQYATAEFTVPQLVIEIQFNVNTSNKSVVASLVTTGSVQINPADYTYQWYTVDASGLSEEEIEGATTLTLDGLIDGKEYKLVATNITSGRVIEGSFVFGTRTVIYVDYNNGSNYNNGLTPNTPVSSMSTAYGKLSSTGTRETNIIVVMGNYNNTNTFNSQTGTTYAKKATITGAYNGTDYSGRLAMGSTGSSTNTYRYMTQDTTFEHITLAGATTTYRIGISIFIFTRI